MKKWSKQVISGLLAVIMVLGMTGCGNGTKAGSNGVSSEDAKKYVYTAQDIKLEIDEGNSNINAMEVINDRLYMILGKYNYDAEPYGATISLLTSGLDGSDMKSVDLILPTGDQTKNVFLGNVIFAEDKFYGTVETSRYDYTDEQNPIEEYAMELACWDLNGQELWRKSLVTNEEYSGEKAGYYVQSMLADANGRLLLLSSTGMQIFDGEGNQVDNIDKFMEQFPNGFNMAYVDKDNKLKMTSWNNDYTKQVIKTFNLETKSFEADVEQTGLNGYSTGMGMNYELILTNQLGVFGYNTGDAEPTQIMSIINSDLDCSDIRQVKEIDDKNFIAIYYDNLEYKMHLAKFTYVDPKDIPDKEVFTLATYWTDSQLKSRIVNYNKTSDKYRIMLKDYSQYSTQEDYLAGYTQLNNDIIGGRVPDILVLDDNMPVDSYITKGVLADINEFLEKDEEIKKEDYLTNVFDAYSVDGKLYRLVSSFYVWTVLGKTADVGAEPGWTLKELQDVMAGKPEETSVFGDLIRTDVLNYALQTSSQQFIDLKAGKCNFNSPAFIELLEFMKQFPEKYDETKYEDPNYWMTQETQYRDGRALLMVTSLRNLQDYNSTVQGTFGEPVTFIGFPTAEGIGTVLRANTQFGISAKSANKDAAWDFLRYYLQDEYQDTVNWELPVKLSAWDRIKKEATEKPYYTDENGNKTEYDQTYWMGDTQITIDPMTSEQVDAVYNFITSLDQAYYYDQNLINIISEESAAFFAGQKGAAEVADIIQSRAQIYVNENK